MITQFKIFENFYNTKYDVGDYVILLEDDVHKKWRVKLEVCIDKILYNESEKEYNYHVNGEYINENIEDPDAEFWINEDEIERKMTTEEIENYKIRKESKKYNL